MDFSQSLASHRQPVATTSLSSEDRHILDVFITWGLRLTVFLIPLFWLPQTSEVFELNKQFLLLGLVVLMFVLWVAKAVFSKSVMVKGLWLKWLVLAWLLVVALATAFSIDRVTSIFGFYGRFNGGLVSVVAYVLLFFLVANTVSTKNEIKNLLGWWLAALGVGAGVLVANLFGWILPFAAAGLSWFGSSLNASVLILAASLPLALWFTKEAQTSLAQWGALAVSALIMLSLLLVDYRLGWLGLVVGLVFWLVMVFIKNESVGFKWTTLPSLFLLLGVLAWPIVTTTFTKAQVPVEVNLSAGASWQIALQNAKVSPILGTGPETFIFGFSKYKPENFNDSNFWAFRFDKAGSEFAQVLSTTGFVGLGVYGLIFLFALYLGWRFLRDTTHQDWYLKVAVVASFLVLFLGQVFYFVNTSVAVAFWMILGLVAGLGVAKKKELSLATSPRASFIFSFGLALVILVALGIFYETGRLWKAEVAFAGARQTSGSADTLTAASDELAKAVTLNPWRDAYHIGYAQVLLAQANLVARQQPAATEEGKKAQIQQLQSYIGQSIAQARAATDLGPENVANWEALGSIYRGTVLFARDAENWVIDSFSQAITKEPSNPALYTELGKAYLISASRKIQESQQPGADQAKLKGEADAQIATAIKQFEKAITLKDNYTPAHFNEALAFELQGKIDEAIGKLERIKEFNPQDVDVLYELGTLYASKNDNDQAIEAFITITDLIPTHANSLYFLGVLYERTGQKDKAIAAFEKVLEGNPDNQQLVDKLNALKNSENTSVEEPKP